MAEPKKDQKEQKLKQQPAQSPNRDTAEERPPKRTDYTAGAQGTQHVEAEPDHSEREWGGDQDIDTAGQVPGNKATDQK